MLGVLKPAVAVTVSGFSGRVCRWAARRRTMAPKHFKMRSAHFPHVESRQHVAELLETSWDAIRHILFRVEPDKRYNTFTIAKRGGGTREIQAPVGQIKTLQQRLLMKLTPHYTPPDCVYAYTFGRSILGNARAHVGCRQLLNIDLKDFFPSIHIGRIIGLFRAWPFGFGPAAAELLAQLCTHNAALPQGAPTSPLLSNMVCYKLDRTLISMAKANRCIYTRYADDISISTRKSTLPPAFLTSAPGEKLDLGVELVNVVAAASFTINETKTRLRSRGQRMIVTGLKINRFPNVSKALFSQVRAMLYAWERHTLEKAEEEFHVKYDKKSRNPNGLTPAFRWVVLGKLLYIGQIRGFRDPKFTALAEALYDLDPTLLPKSPTYATEQLCRLATCVLTDDSGARNGTGCFVKGVGLVTCAHVSVFATRAFYPDAPNIYGAVAVVRRKVDYDLAVCETTLLPRGEFLPRYKKVTA